MMSEIIPSANLILTHCKGVKARSNKKGQTPSGCIETDATIMDPSPASDHVVTTAVVASTNRLTPPPQPPQRDHWPLYNAAPVHSNIVIFSVSNNDVLLGRGAPMAKFIGNVRFRSLICLYKQRYNATNRQRIKRHIAKDVWQEIQRRGGRFLVPLSATEKSRYHVPPSTQKAWFTAREEIVMDKIMQALRATREPSSASLQMYDSVTVETQTAVSATPHAGREASVSSLSPLGSFPYDSSQLPLTAQSGLPLSSTSTRPSLPRMPQASIALQHLVPLSRVSPLLQLQTVRVTAIAAPLSGLAANDTVASAILANSSPRSFPSILSTSMDSMMAHQQLTPHDRLPFGLSMSSLPNSAQHSICIQQVQQQYVQRQEEQQQQRQQLEYVLEQLQRQQL